MNLVEIRQWVTLAAAVAAAAFAIYGHLETRRQRRLENSFRLLDLFRRTIDPADLEAWKQVFHGSSEPAGAKPGHFLLAGQDGTSRECPFEDLFNEGPPDNGAIGKMCDLFELIAREAQSGTINLPLVYFEVGQLMDTTHHWVSSIGQTSMHPGSLLSSHYPAFAKLYKAGKIKADWAKRSYAHIG